jgi:glucose-1-phosphate cytidylyltransferase
MSTPPDAAPMKGVTAILLCGGKGERLKPFTEQFPKPLVPVHGKPLLLHLVNYLAAGGISRFVFCVGYKAELVQSFVRQSCAGLDHVCVDSGDVSMTDRLLDARAHAPGPALVCYGDTLANVNLAELRQAHDRKGGLATVTIYPMRSPFGLVEFDGGQRVTRFSEKPMLPYWINIGFLLCARGAMDRLRRGVDMPEFLEGLRAENQLFVHPHRGTHVTINTEKDRAVAETELIEMLTL